MSTILREEPAPYGPSPEEAAMLALEKMDWTAYDQVMDERLQRSVQACAHGEAGIPLEEAMQRLQQKAAGRREARVG